MGCGASSGGGRRSDGGSLGGTPRPLTAAEIQQRVVAIDKPRLFRMTSAPLTARYAFVSQRGYYPEDLNKANQDAFLIAEQVCGEEESILFGVFDGHGSTGDKCAGFAKDHMLHMFEKNITRQSDDFEHAYTDTFLEINERLHADVSIDDMMSGTTAITCFMSGAEICVANVGDSRAIVCESRPLRNGADRLVALPLSNDQTPYRADERERVKKCGAEVMSCNQKDGELPYHENWGLNLGEDVDTGGDPPRVWESGQDYPGCAFTRSIGDAIAKDIGVVAEPELLSKQLLPHDRILVIASDGVFEFITNQGCADIVSQYACPLEAGRALVAEAYRLWLQYEVRTDDITVIVVFLDWDSVPRPVGAPAAPPPPTAAGASPCRLSGSATVSPILRRSKALARRRLDSGVDDLVSLGLQLRGTSRPVRRGISKEKRRMIMASQPPLELDSDDDADAAAADGAGAAAAPVKTEAELARIAAAVRTNFLFAHLADAQRAQLFVAMKRVEVRKGDVVIKQGDPGDWFYVVDEGEFEVTQRQGDGAGNETDVRIFTYTSEGEVRHCFGELALMYSRPRAATVTARTDGVLWAMARSTFRRVLVKSSAHDLTRALRSVDVLSSLSVAQLLRLHDIVCEVSFAAGEVILTQGESGSQFFIIVEGSVVCTRRMDAGDASEEPTELIRLKAHQYFGEKALLNDARRAANVVALAPTRCLRLERAAFEEVLGPLQDLIDEDARARETAALVKAIDADAAGLSNAALADFSVLAVVMRGDVGDLAVVTSVPRANAAGQPSGEIEPAAGSAAAARGFYTMRTLARRPTVATKQVELVLREIELMGALPPSTPGVAVELLCLPTRDATYAVLRAVLLTNLAAVMAESVLEPHECAFYAAALAQALHALHAAGVVCRNVNPEYLMLDALGYPQLVDLRLAKRVEGKTYTTCGSPDYLAPEMVQGEGHSFAADFWALGALVYEMLTGESPFAGAADDAAAPVGELDLYKRITAHTHRAPLPRSAELTPEARSLVDDLLHPDPLRRLGAKAGIVELHEHAFFDGFDWDALLLRQILAPHHSVVRKLFDAVKESAPTPAVDALVYPEYVPADPDPFEGFDEARDEHRLSRMILPNPSAPKSLRGSRKNTSEKIPSSVLKFADYVVAAD